MDGRLAAVTLPRWNTVSYSYNASNLRTSVTDANGNTETYTYDAKGNVLTKTNALANTWTFTYNAKNDVLTSTTPGGQVTSRTYNTVGNLVSVANPMGHNTSFTVNANGLVTAKTDSNSKTTNYAYNSNGHLTSVTTPGGKVTSLAYNVLGMPTSHTDNLSRIHSISYDNLGRKLTETTPTYAVGYTYDNAGQLTGEVRTGASPYSIGYTYDNAGNRASKTLGGTTESYTYDDANKLLTAGGKSYTYDAAGNVTDVTWSGGSTSLAWDAESRLKSATSGESATNYAYNGIGQRVAKSGAITAAYLLSDDSIDSQVLADGNSSYVHGVSGLVSENRAGTSKFYHEDGLGSVRALTNSSGTITDERSTDAFGMVFASSGATPTPFGFAGAYGYQQDSETGLMRLGHRMYDSSTGRFISRDPIRDGYNWYTYCENDPLNAIDPTGELPILGLLLLAVAALALEGCSNSKPEPSPWIIPSPGPTPPPTPTPLWGHEQVEGYEQPTAQNEEDIDDICVNFPATGGITGPPDGIDRPVSIYPPQMQPSIPMMGDLDGETFSRVYNELQGIKKDPFGK